MTAAGGSGPFGLGGAQPVGVHQHLCDRGGRRCHQCHVPASGAQRDGDVLRIDRRSAQQEHRRRRRFLDDLQQRICRPLGEAVGVLDDDDLPAPGGRAPRCRGDDGPHLVHTDRQAFRDDATHIGMRARHCCGACAAFAASGHTLSGALQRSRETQGGHRTAGPRRPGDQPGMCHRAGGLRVVSRITPRRHSGSNQLRLHRALTDEPRENT